MPNEIEKFLLRLGIGGGLLVHGIGKITGGIGYIERLLHAHNLPEWMAYGVYIGEIVAPIALILGLRTRIAAGIIVVNMLFALILGFGSSIFTIQSDGGWAAESTMLYLLGALAIAMGGGGRIGLRW